MFKPKHQIILDKESFPQDKFMCLGSQMISIINALDQLLEPHCWYGADINAVSEEIRKNNLDADGIRKIGDSVAVVEICTKVGQFLSGIFLAVKNDNSREGFNKTIIETEDEQYRSIELKGVLIEIRAFDTSYFEIYSEEEFLIERLSGVFKGKRFAREGFK